MLHPIDISDASVEELLGLSPGKQPLFASPVQAGFPSPADDFLEGKLDLNRYLIDREHATFLFRVSGDSMRDAGIVEGDILVVDRAKTAGSGDTVVAEVDGEWTVKIFRRCGMGWRLDPANPEFTAITGDGERPLQIFGVVVGVVRRMSHVCTG